MFARFALRNERIVVFAVVVLAILGIRAYVVTPAGIFPTMQFSRIDVVADAGDLPPDRVRIAIAQPLEQRLASLPGATNVLATASQGSAELLVDFTQDTSQQLALQRVDEAIAQVRGELSGASNVVAQAVDTNREPVVCYALTSNDLSQTVVRDLAVREIVPKLIGVPGFARASLTGGATTEYRVTLDPARLVALGLGAADVAKALADAGEIRATGTVSRFYAAYAVLVDASLHDRASLEAVRVPLKDGSSVPLGSLGTVSLGTAPITVQSSLDGRPAVLLNAYASPGANTVEIVRALRARIAAVAASLPADLKIEPYWDQSTLIVASQEALRDAILIGALLAIGVIYAFLRDIGLTLIAAAMIPLALAIAIFALQLGGQTLNLMSAGGLAVAVGLIIDDAIVVIENIARNRRERTAFVIEPAMIASTLATVVVFVPLALLDGVAGFFFRALAFTLAASLIVSLALALVLAPVLARTFVGDGRDRRERADPLAGVIVRYVALLRWALAHRAIVAAASVAILAVTVVILAGLPSDFLPQLDEGQFEIGYTLPVGTSLAAAASAARDMERVVGADPAVESVAGLSGVDSNGVTPTQPNQGTLRIRLVDPARRAGYVAIADRLRRRLAAAVPSALFDFRQLLEDLIDDLSGNPSPVEITLRGDDRTTLATLAQRVAARIGNVPGVVDAASGIAYDGPSIRLAPRGGVSAADLGDALAALGHGTVATTIAGTRAVVPVRVAVAAGAPDAQPLDPSQSLYLGGEPTALRNVATARIERLSTDIVTQNGRLIDRVTAGTDGTSLSSITAGIRAELATMPLPPGYDATIGGQAQTQARSFAQFATVIGLAVVLVFGVMVAAFRSFRIPLVILTAIPLALIGVALGLFLTRTPFNVSSFMGLLLLVGIVVKNGILFVDVANRRRSEGAPMHDALLEAGTARLRPILMTTLAAIGGLLPLAFGIGQGSEMEKPLAIAVIGGLSTATVFTLIVIPVIYAAIVRTAKIPVHRRFVASATVALLVLGIALPAHAQTAQPAQTAQTAADASSTEPLLVFADVSLDAASQAALANAPAVAEARAKTAESRAALATARASIAPSLVANYAQVPQGNPPGPNVISRQVSTVVQFSVGDFVAYSAAVREAAFGLAAAEADERAAEIAERTNVAGRYYDALKDRALAAAAQDAVDLALAQREAVRVRLKAGDVAQLDLLRAEVELAKAQAALELADASAGNALDALVAETALAPGTLDAVASTVVAPPAMPLDPQTAVARARALRPEIASAQRTVEAADAALGAARAASFPALTIGGGYLVGSDSGVPVSAPTIVANLTLPLGAGARANTGAASARTLEARAKAAAVERDILVAVGASARTLAASERAALATDRERDAAAAELRATQVGYRDGASSSLELSIARGAATQARIDALAARYDLQKARAILAIEVGE